MRCASPMMSCRRSTVCRSSAAGRASTPASSPSTRLSTGPGCRARSTWRASSAIATLCSARAHSWLASASRVSRSTRWRRSASPAARRTRPRCSPSRTSSTRRWLERQTRCSTPTLAPRSASPRRRPTSRRSWPCRCSRSTWRSFAARCTPARSAHSWRSWSRFPARSMRRSPTPTTSPRSRISSGTPATSSSSVAASATRPPSRAR